MKKNVSRIQQSLLQIWKPDNPESRKTGHGERPLRIFFLLCFGVIVKSIAAPILITGDHNK